MHAYTIRIKKNCKRIIIRIINSEVVVTVPPYVQKKTIDSFVESKGDWIESNLAVDKRKFTAIKDLTSIYLFGIKHAVYFINSGRKTVGIKKEDAFIIIDAPISSEDEKIITALKNWLKKMATHYVEQRIAFLTTREDVASITDRYMEKWRVRYMKTAFGLCYAQKREIVLNVELVLYPPQFLDYVILHEITHFLHQNHSKQYYQAFEQLEPQWKRLKQELNQWHKDNGGWSYR